MTDPLSPDEGTKPLRTKLKAGVDSEYDVHGTDATTVKLNWSIDFKESVRNMAASAQFWSQTECEMVLMAEAVEQVSSFMEDTGISWLFPMKQVALSIEHNTNSRAHAMSVLKGGEANLGTLHVDEHNDVNYRPKILKKDNRRLNTDVEDFGITKRDRIIIGLSILIDDNRDLFLPGSIQEAQRIHETIKPQIAGLKRQAKSFVEEMGSVARKADERGNVYENEMEKTLKMMKSEYPECLVHFEEEYTA